MKEKKPLTHPSFDELLALTVDDLGDQRAHEVREHLLDCPACLAQTRELLRLPDEAPSPEMELSDAELAMDWQRLSATLDEEEEATQQEPYTGPQLKVLPGGLDPASPPTATPPAARPARSTPIWLVAALVAGMAIGIAFGRGALFGPGTAPLQAVALTSLASSSSFQRGELAKPKEAECPPPGGAFGLVIAPNLALGDSTKTLWVEISKAAGQILAGKQLAISKQGDLQFLLPRSLLANGQYLVTVKRKAAEEEPTIDEMRLSVECP